MKFTLEEFVEALRTEMTAGGKKLSISDRTIKTQAERIYHRLEKAADADSIEKKDAVEEYLPDFREMDGNVRYDNSQFVKNYEKDHPANEDKKKSAEGDNHQETEMSELGKLLKRLEALEADALAAKNQRIVTERREALRAALKEKGIKDEKWADAYLRKISIDNDTDVEREADEALAFYNLNNASRGGGNANVGNSGGGKDEEIDFSDIVSIRKRQRGMVSEGNK